MKYTLLKTFPNSFFEHHEGPCISIYMPVEAKAFDHKKNQLTLKNLIKEVESSLSLSMNEKDIKPIIDRLELVVDDKVFWNHVKKGLALFMNQEDMALYHLDKKVDQLAVVARTYHLKPLYAYFQALKVYDILALEAESFKLYEGHKYHIEKVEMPKDVKTTSEEVLGKDHTESYQTHGTYGGANDGSTFHGHGGKSDDIEIDRINFFRYVDHTVYDIQSKKTERPLVLLALKEHHHDFMDISKNQYLIKKAIDGSIRDMAFSELQAVLKDMSDESFHAYITKIKDNYHRLSKEHQSTNDINKIIKGFIERKVDVLMIEKDKILPGKIDLKQYKYLKEDIKDPKVDDVLDDLIEHAEQTGAKVFILNQDDMPTSTGVAAIFRY
jgi:hypothetical protein